MGVGLILLVVQVLLLGSVFYSFRTTQQKTADRFIKVGLQAVTTHQISLLNQLGAIAINETNAAMIMVCNDQKTVAWSYPKSTQNCQVNQQGDYRRVERSLFSDNSYPKIIFYFPFWPQKSLLWMGGISVVIIIFGGFCLLWRLRYYIVKDVYQPIRDIGKGEKNFLIEEFDLVNKNLCSLREQEKQYFANQALMNIATQVAHDIRSPLSSMQSAIEYLGHLKIEDPKGTDVLNLLELSAKRLTRIADNLLRKHQGQDGLEPSSVFSIHQVLDELVGEFQGQEEYRNIHFVKQYSSNAIHLRGNATKIQRAFGNIINNAAEAMTFQGTITFRTENSGEKVNISIADTGPGMTEEKLQKVLAGGHTEGKADGHGIGTKVVRETVEEHQGNLRAESTLGQGTTFFIDLPCITHAEAIHTFTLNLNPNETVLIVDDDAGLREQWRLVLKDHGIKTLLCDSYEDVVRQNINLDLTPAAIVDYHFENSEKSGVDVVKYLQSIRFKNLYLCTAEYWKPILQREAKELCVPLCPKPLPAIVIQAIPSPEKKGFIEEPKMGKAKHNVLVIDDDPAILMSWELRQEQLEIKELKTFQNLETLISAEIDLSTIDLAFVDKNIDGSKHNGGETITYLKQKGLQRVVLASGENVESLKNDPQFKEVDFFLQDKIPKSIKEFMG